MACKCLIIGGVFIVAIIFVLTKFAGGKAPCSCCRVKDKKTDAPMTPEPTSQTQTTPPLTTATTAMKLKSSAFEHNAVIPDKYTCNGQNISPSLNWGTVPSETKSLVLLCDDPDAPRERPWVHWVVYNIPATATGMPKNVPTLETLDNGAQQGVNDFGTIGYGGPCPPVGHGVHHYHFKLYALNSKLSLAPRATKAMVDVAMQGKIISTSELIGTYQR